jgi:arylsulfatase A-like enzyme
MRTEHMNPILAVLTAVLIALLLAPLASLHASDVAIPAVRPNIIFLLTDDQSDNTLGAMGHPFVKTQHLDALMQDSVRFKNTYIATPVFSPSRVSYFTGMPERVDGVGFSSLYDLTEQQWERTYPALLRKGGYFTGLVGKFGVEYYTFRGKEADIDFHGRTPEFEMLFDLQADPIEHHNLATDPKHAAILAELRQKTAAQSIAINQRREVFMKSSPVQPRVVAAKRIKNAK